MARRQDDDEFAEEPLPPEDDDRRPPKRRRLFEEDDAPVKSSKATLIIILSVVGVVLVLCAGCGIGGYFFLQNIAEENKKQAEKYKRQDDLHRIFTAYQDHNNQKFKPPLKAEDLKNYLGMAEEVYARLKDGSVVFFYGATTMDIIRSGQATSNTVLAYDGQVPEKGGPVLFADGSVRQMTATDFANTTKAKNVLQANVDTTRARLKSVEAGAVAFKKQHFRWPFGTNELTNPPGGALPLIQFADSLDAWNQGIIIAPNPGDPNRPLVYSFGPPGSKDRITNMEK